MKTSIKTLLAAALVLVLSAAAPTVQAADKNPAVTTLSNVKNISKIVVSGNVDLILVQSYKESVKVYDTYYSKNALVQQEDGTLRISSFAKEKLSVTVYVKDLTSLEAANNVTVSMYNKFSLLSLNVMLKDSATAIINADAFNLYTSVNDQANLKLTGAATDYVGIMGARAIVSMDQFTAESSSIRSVSPIYTAKINLAKESNNAFEIITEQ